MHDHCRVHLEFRSHFVDIVRYKLFSKMISLLVGRNHCLIETMFFITTKLPKQNRY